MTLNPQNSAIFGHYYSSYSASVYTGNDIRCGMVVMAGNPSADNTVAIMSGTATEALGVAEYDAYAGAMLSIITDGIVFVQNGETSVIPVGSWVQASTTNPGAVAVYSNGVKIGKALDYAPATAGALLRIKLI